MQCNSAMSVCSVRWKIASDYDFELRFPSRKPRSFCGISGSFWLWRCEIASDCDCAILLQYIRTPTTDRHGGRCLEGVCPPPRGFPWKPLLRVSVSGRLVCELALFVCDNVWYYVTVLSCQRVVSHAVCSQRGLSGRTFSGVPVPFRNLECYCAPRGGYLGGGASAPRYQGPLERLSREAGRPMGPSTPLCFSQSCAFVCLVSC